MKITITIYCLLVCLCAGCAQPKEKVEVPAPVSAKFSSLYPAATKVDWEKEDGKYEASFLQEKKEVAVIFLQDGMVAQTETESDVAALPVAIKDYVKQNLEGKDIKEVTLISDSNGSISWEIEVGHVDYLFTADGKLISKEEEKEKNDDK